MEGCSSTGQIPQRAVVPMEEEEYNTTGISDLRGTDRLSRNAGKKLALLAA
jgi:hypothetical protein